MQKWITGLLGSIGAVLLATAVAWAGSDQGILYNDLSVFVWCGVFARRAVADFVHAWFAQTELFSHWIADLYRLGSSCLLSQRSFRYSILGDRCLP